VPTAPARANKIALFEHRWGLTFLLSKDYIHIPQ
jgi:hypothetical protein